MRRNVQVLLLLLSGAAVLHISLFSELYLRYVKEGLRPALIASGVLLVLLGSAGAALDGFPFARTAPDRDRTREDGGRDAREAADGEHREAEHRDRAERDGAAGNGAEEGGGHGTEGGGGHGHDHGHGPRVAWLLFLPVVSLLVFTPPALGSFSAARESPKPLEAASRFSELPDRAAVPLQLADFRARAELDRRRSLEGRTVRLTGFVTPGGEGRWRLTRLVLSCCAADAQSVTVDVYGASPPPADSWVGVTGTWRPVGRPGTSSAVAALDVEQVERIPEPGNPYVDPAPRW